MVFVELRRSKRVGVGFGILGAEGSVETHCGEANGASEDDGDEAEGDLLSPSLAGGLVLQTAKA
jgi:hypothetical protein